MPMIKVTLSIGYPSATRRDEIEVDNDEYNDCETDEQRDNLLFEYWKEWSNDFIEGDWKVIK
jgi:hypothetical protein